MAIRLDLARDEAEDKLQAQIAAMDEAFRRLGRIGDLIRLRDWRVRAGLARPKTGQSSVLQRAFVGPPQSDLDEAGGVPEVDMSSLDHNAVHAALERNGAVVLRNAIPVRRTLDLRTMFEAALVASRDLLDLEAEDLPDIRHTDGKEMFYPVPEKIALPQNAARAFLGDQNILATFLSPRIAFEWLDILIAQGFRTMLQKLLQDDLRLVFDRCLIRRMQAQDPSPDWSHGVGVPGRGLLLWLPMAECGQGTQRPGLDIMLHSQARLGDHKSAPARPFVAAGDAILIKNTQIISKSSDPNFTHETIAVETCFIGRSRAGLSDLPVFW
ncbi:MAG: hypothetical protein AAFY35_07920 [Pseudomonadota bacterium]